MTRWLLALLFAFGTVTFLSACEKSTEDKVEDATEDVKEGAEDVKEGAEDVVEDVTE